MAINIPAAQVNILMGKAQMGIESIAGEFFGKANTVAAETAFANNLRFVVKELGNRVKHNKLSLFMEYFNTKQDYERMIRSFEMHKNTKLGRALELESLFMFNDAGEFYLQNLTALALAHNTVLKDQNGKDVNL